MKKRVHKRLPDDQPRFQWRYVYMTEAVDWNNQLIHLATHAYENDARQYTLDKWDDEMRKGKPYQWAFIRIRKEKVYVTPRTRMNDNHYSINIIAMFEFPTPDGEDFEYLSVSDFR